MNLKEIRLELTMTYLYLASVMASGSGDLKEMNYLFSLAFEDE